MNAKEFLNNKGISTPTIEGVRLSDSKMNIFKIIDLMEEYAKKSNAIAYAEGNLQGYAEALNAVIASNS